MRFLDRLTRRRRRNERGAFAILFSLGCVMLFTFAALGVDIGNAVSRRTDIQTQADYGAYAAAQQLPMTATNKVGQAVDSEVIDAVVDAMNENQPQDDDRPCWTNENCITAGQLTDSDMTNGDVRYVSGCTSTSAPGCHKTDGLQVLSPENWVDYGLADIIGIDGANVRADATVNVFTGGLRVMPMFAVTGCDYGNQTLADPASGHATTTVPTLYLDGDTNTIDLTADTQVLTDSTPADVDSLVKDSTSNMLRFEGSNWDKARKIGFFRSDDSSVPPLIQTTFWQYGDATKTNLNVGTGYTKPSPQPNGPVTVQLDIPPGVTASEGVWYVRVWRDTDAAGHWSPKDEALPIRVGQSFLQCASDVNSGNFGTLEFPRTDTTPSNDIAVNIAVGLQPPLTPTRHQWAVDNPTSAGECFEGTNGAVISEHDTLRTGTNCLATITGGLAPNDATAGLVTGAVGHPGSLTTAPTTPDPDGSGGCDPDGGTNERTVSIPSNPTFHLNDDTLSCFLIDDTTSLQQLVDPDYAESDPPLLTREIFDSPRFFYVPVFAIQPEFGGSNRYSIIDFRPAFITDELVAPSTTKGVHTASDDNGVVFFSNKIEQLDVIFFNVNTLPNETEDSLIDFLGVGRRIVRMID
jgi:hypothetical protein